MNATCTQLLTPLEAADILRLPTRQVTKLAKSGTIPRVVLPGDEIRFDEADLRAWIEARKQDGKGATDAN